MEIKEYQKLAKVTCTSLGSDKLDLSHMVMGMCSELNEIYEALEKRDMVNALEEYSDLFFYLANYCTFRGHDLEKMVEDKEIIKGNYSELVINISKLTDIVKKYIAYNKPIEITKELECISNIYLSVLQDLEKGGLDLSVGLDRNIAKLQARYGGKFTEEAALNRNLEVERSILEGNA